MRLSTTLAFTSFVVAGFVADAVLSHEAHRTIRFVAIADGQSDIHPARSIEIAFQQTVPQSVSVVLTNGGKTIPTVSGPVADDPAKLLVRSAEPLQWASSYRLCIVRQRHNVVQTLLGPRIGCISFRSQEKPRPTGSPEAPILIVLGRDEIFGAYYAEILKAEGFGSTATEAAEDLVGEDLTHRSVIVLATSHLAPSMVTAVTEWVKAGGLLIAMRPGPDLYPALGLNPIFSGRIREAHLVAGRRASYTRGIAETPLRLHGPVELLSIPKEPAGAHTADFTASVPGGVESGVLAQLTDRRGKLLPYPAVILSGYGRGHAVVFAFSMAESIALSRQGNPMWIDQERDGSEPRRPNDLFFPDYVDLDSVGVPQADELQRLFANIIVAAASQPVLRFWYLPNGRRAAVIMAGDDHATPDGTSTLFERLNADSAPGCRLDRWECLRATAYITPPTEFVPALAEHYAKLGFEIGVHVDGGCENSSTPSLAAIVRAQVDGFRAAYPQLPRQRTHRIHCVLWNGWVDLPRIEHQNGIRLDMNYYYWPPEWVEERPGFMTGSGFPMPYIDENGRVLDIYQAATHLVNQDGIPEDYGISVMLDRALGSDQFFGAFGTHYDFTSAFAEKLVDAATARGVALISAAQMLNWLDGRNDSNFEHMRWDGTKLSFTIDLKEGAEQASVMLPETFQDKRLATLACGGNEQPIIRQEIKGLEYATFQAVSGNCEAQYLSGPYAAK